MAHDLSNLSPEVIEFMTERHLATLSLAIPALASSAQPLHVTPVGFSYDASTQTARVITFAGAKKVRLIERHSPDGPIAAALSQVDGGRWLTLYGAATVTADPEVNADAERRYAARYRPPGDRGADRRTILVAVDRIVGRA